MNFDYDEVTPGPKPETMDEFLSCLLMEKDSMDTDRDRVNRLFNEVSRPCCQEICSRILKKIRDNVKHA